MKLFFLVLSLIVSLKVFAQPIWQQQVNTKIEVRLDDINNVLYAQEEFNYINNSPDTLSFIIIHLWPNAYKNDHTPFAKQMDLNGKTSFYYSKLSERGYIDSLQFTVNGYSAEYNSSNETPDIVRLNLPNPLYPGQTVKIATPFKVKIPIVFSRMGHNEQAYFISQWFPKPAVYDQKGWHPLSYLENGEFFSEFGSYDVDITLPKNYVLMATGNIMTESENKWLDGMAQDSFPKDTLYKTFFPPSSTEMKTVHFHEDKVHDFAWFADKRWIVRKDTVYSPGNNQLVTTWAAFLPSYRKTWQYANEYLKETIKHYGTWVGAYPYKTIKAVLGDMHAGGGMEYPTVTVIDKSASSTLKTVVVHEAGHNWFYGMLGSNERDHAWMDEGLNTFYEKKTSKDIIDSVLKKKVAARINDTVKNGSIKTKSRGVSIKLGNSFNEDFIYYELASIHGDMAVDQTSANFPFINYGIDVYYKTTLMLTWLEKYMGSEDFRKGMQYYFKKWCYHHPYPEDFMYCMQQNTQKDISWFYNPGLVSDKPLDFRISNASIQGDSTLFTLKNKTGLLAPILINAYKNGSITKSVWTTPFAKTTQFSIPTTDWTTLRIDTVVPDFKSTHKVYHNRGLFPTFSLAAKPFFGINTSYQEKVFYLPAVGFNDYSGIMVGLMLHNLTMPENKFKFVIAPMYATNSKTFVGTGSIGYTWFSDGLFKETLIQLESKSFQNAEEQVRSSYKFLTYTKIAPSLNFTLNEHNPLSTVSRTLSLKYYDINEQYFKTDYSLKNSVNTYEVITYKHKNNRTYNPFGYVLEVQNGNDFAKVNLEGNIRIDYNRPKKSLYVRGYFGKYFATNSGMDISSSYGLNASFNGLNDYLYDGTYFGRTSQNGLAARQISLQEGGFKVPIFNTGAKSDDWMTTVNLKTDLPLRTFPLRLFFDAGLIPNNNLSFTNAGSTNLLYDGGLEIYLFRNAISIYIPIIMSNDFYNFLSNTYGNKNVFNRSVSFSINWQNINWLKSPLKSLKLG